MKSFKGQHMKLAKAFAEIDSADRAPAATTIKRYMPIGSVSGSGVVSVSAFDAIVQQQQLQFRGVRFDGKRPACLL